MDEHSWFNCTDPLALLAAIHPMCTLGSDPPQTRLSRMYLLACARRRWHRLPGVCRTLVSHAELFADNSNEMESLRASLAPIAERLMNSDAEPDDSVQQELAKDIAEICSFGPEVKGFVAEPRRPSPSLTAEEWQDLARLVYLPFEYFTPAYHWVPRKYHSLGRLHEVYGNPYRLVSFEDAWRTDTVLTLAGQMYKTRNFEAMPILADALQDAGCDCDAALNHCRDMNATHVRGCWVLDHLLKLR